MSGTVSSPGQYPLLNGQGWQNFQLPSFGGVQQNPVHQNLGLFGAAAQAPVGDMPANPGSGMGNINPYMAALAPYLAALQQPQASPFTGAPAQQPTSNPFAGVPQVAPQPFNPPPQMPAQTAVPGLGAPTQPQAAPMPAPPPVVAANIPGGGGGAGGQ